MKDLLDDINKLENKVQKLSVIDEEIYNYFRERIESLRSDLVNVDDADYQASQEVTSKIIEELTKLEFELSNYMQTGSITRPPVTLTFGTQSKENANQSGNEKIKAYRLGLLKSTIDAAKQDVEIDFNKLEKVIEKINSEKNNQEGKYSDAEIAYIDELIAELFIEYQKKYYNKNGNLPTEKPETYCNPDAYERKFKTMISSKLIEEQNRLDEIKSLVLSDNLNQNYQSDKLWNMITSYVPGNKNTLQTVTREDKSKENKTISEEEKNQDEPNNQLMIPKKRTKIKPGKPTITVYAHDIFGNPMRKIKKVNWKALSKKGIRENLIKIVFPDGTYKIPDDLCKKCFVLEEVILPEGLNEIGSNAFKGCRRLRTIDFPKSLRIIGFQSFSETGLEKIEIPDNIEKIMGFAFDRIEGDIGGVCDCSLPQQFKNQNLRYIFGDDMRCINITIRDDNREENHQSSSNNKTPKIKIKKRSNYMDREDDDDERS